MSKVIEVWIDFNSPLSYLGLWNLEKALHLAQRTDLVVSYRTFQIDPEFKPDRASDLSDFQHYLKTQKNLLNLPVIQKMVRAAGIKFNFAKVAFINTFNAHCLMQLEKIHHWDLESEVVASLFHAYWVDGIDIANLENLQKIGSSANLDPELISLMVTNKQVLNAVFEDEHAAINYQISAVPFFKFPTGDQIQGLMTIEQGVTLIQKIK